MDTNKFRYLFETNECGSMRAASDKLNVAPSSISRQISQLEQALGIELIERHRRKVMLTEVGELALKYYREGKALDEALKSEIEDFRGVRTGTVTLSVGEGFIGSAFLAALDNFTIKYPNVKLVVDVRASTDHVLSTVLSDEAHIGLIFQSPPDPKMHVQYSFKQPVMAIMAPSHRLASMQSVKLADLVNEKVALPRKHLRTRQLFDEAAAAEGVHFSPTMSTNSLHLLKKFAELSNGITILSPLAVSGELGNGKLVAKRIRSLVLSETAAYIVTRRGRSLTIAAREILYFLAQISKIENV